MSGSKRINSVIMSAATVIVVGAPPQTPKCTKFGPRDMSIFLVKCRENAGNTQLVVGRFARIDSRFAKKKTFFFFANRPSRKLNGWQRGLDANHANLNASRRDDAIRANLAKCFKNSFSLAGRFARIDSRESAQRWCANRLPTEHPSLVNHPFLGKQLG